MARDVEFNLTASDKTGSALASAERAFKRSNDRIKKQNDDLTNGLTSSIAKGLVNFASQFSPKFAGSMAKAFAAAGDVAGPALVAAIVGVAPLLGATVAGAVIGGAAGLGVIGGLLLVSKDARVQAAGTALGQRLFASLQHDSTVFVGPVIKAVSEIGTAFDRIEPHIRSIFANASQFVAPLTKGLIGFAEPIIAGFDRLVAKAGPVIRVISVGFAQIGKTIGQVFEQLGTQGPAAAAALAVVFGLIDVTIRSVGTTILVLTKVFGTLLEVMSHIPGVGGGIKAGLDALKKSGLDTGTSMDALRTAFQGTAPAAQTMADKLAAADQAARDLAGSERTLYGSTTNAKQAIVDATKAIKENGATLDINTAKGRANRTALDGVANALVDNYANYVKVNGVGKASEQVANNNRAAFIRLAEKAGASARAAQELATKLGLIPGKKTTEINANTHDAEARIKALQGQINALRGKTVTITVRRVQTNGDIHVSGTGGSGTQVKNAANDDFRPGVGGTFRTGGPTPVNNNVAVSVSLDGRPFAAMVATEVSKANKRNAFRAKVGRR